MFESWTAYSYPNVSRSILIGNKLACIQMYCILSTYSRVEYSAWVSS